MFYAVSPSTWNSVGVSTALFQMLTPEWGVWKGGVVDTFLLGCLALLLDAYHPSPPLSDLSQGAQKLLDSPSLSQVPRGGVGSPLELPPTKIKDTLHEYLLNAYFIQSGGGKQIHTLSIVSSFWECRNWWAGTRNVWGPKYGHHFPQAPLNMISGNRIYRERNYWEHSAWSSNSYPSKADLS